MNTKDDDSSRFLLVLLFLIAVIGLSLDLVIYVAGHSPVVIPAPKTIVLQATLSRQPVQDKPIRKKQEQAEARKVRQKNSMPTPDMPRGNSGTGNADALPYLETHSEDAGAYLRWIIRQGGALVLTRGFYPVALLDAAFTSKPVPDGFRLPSRARNVSSELRGILNALPDSATLALLIWPRHLEIKLEQALRALPVSQRAARLRASYVLNQGRLEIHINQALIRGNWTPVQLNIAL